MTNKLHATETRDGIEFGTVDRDAEVRHLKAAAPQAVVDRAALLERLKTHRTKWLRGLAEKGGINDETRSVLAIASTGGVDRDEEIVLPSGMKAALKPFLASSSPLLSQHTHRTANGAPGQVGWVMNGLVDTGLTLNEMRFDDPADAADPAHGWWSRASNRKGKGIQFSIGFRPLRYARGQASDLAREFPEIRQALRDAGLADDDRMLVWVEFDLLEISCVPVGANQGTGQVIDAKDLAAHPELAAAIATPVVEAVKAKLDEITADAAETLADVRDEIAALLPALGEAENRRGSDSHAARPPVPDPGGGDGVNDGVRDAAERLARVCQTD